MRFMLIFNLLLLSSFPVWANDKIIRDQTWRLCNRDSDCVVAESLCPNTYWAINQRYLWKNARVNERMRKVITCSAAQEKKPEHGECLGGVCVIR